MSEETVIETVGAIVAADFRAAAVFQRFGIDFCCGGQRSLTDACRTAAADPEDVIRALEEIPSRPLADDDDVIHWTVERLVDHIVSTHHAYVRSAVPAIGRYLAKLADVHGTRHPELHRIAAYFDRIGADLHQHMIKEEQVLFPYVRDLAENAKQTCGAILSPFGTVANPIRMMEREHREVADALRMIKELTRGYKAPADGCTTYAVCMQELERFEQDLHRHVHLENNVLFPKALELEGERV